MTLIFGFVRNNKPFLVGDSLLTGSGATPLVETLPIAGRIGAPSLASDFGIVVSGLRQKVNIIAESVALAWSGSYLEAFGLAKEVAAFVLQRGVLLDEMIQIIRTNAGADLSCIAMFSRGNDVTYLWHNADHNAALRRFQNVCCAGSGSQYFKEMICKLDTVDPIHSNVSPAQGFDADFHGALGDTLSIASQAIGRELLSPINMLERWGGAIEVCYRGPRGRFMKLDRVAFTHFNYNEERPEEGLKWRPRLLLNRYSGAYLDCLSLQCEDQQDSPRLKVVADNSEVIRPLLGLDEPYTPLPRRFDYDILCTHFTYYRGDEAMWSMSHVDFCPNSEGPFRAELRGSEVDVVFTKKLGDWMRQQIRAYQDGTAVGT